MMRGNKPKRILMLLENGGYPGDTRVLLEAEALFRAGFDVTIICPTDKSVKWAETIGGICVYRFPRTFSPTGFLGYVWEYGYSIIAMFLISIFVFLRRGFDVVHVHTPPDMTAVIAIFYQLFGKKFVFDHHDLSPELYLARRGDDRPNGVYKVLRFFERLACRRADRLIATNATQQSIQRQRCGAKAEHCYILRNGPNESFLKNVQPRPELRESGQFVLGYVGAIGIQDGVDYMVRVVHELKANRGREDFFAVIVGDGPALGDLKSLASELDVADVIRFIGSIPFSSVPAYIASFDICITPDPSNPYNDSCATIKTMEYMALRKPTVSFRTIENSRTAGEAALYADDNDVVAFAELVVQLMDDEPLRKSMGAIARRRIDSGLTWDHQAPQLLALYEDMLEFSSRDLSSIHDQGLRECGRHN